MLTSLYHSRCISLHNLTKQTEKNTNMIKISNNVNESITWEGELSKIGKGKCGIDVRMA